MRRADISQSEMFGYQTLEQQIPAAHPLRKLRALVDGTPSRVCAHSQAQTQENSSECVPLRTKTTKPFLPESSGLSDRL